MHIDACNFGRALSASLNPQLTDIGDDVLGDWAPAFSDKAERKSVLRNERLHSRLIERLSGVSDRDFEVFEGHERLNALLEADIEKVIQCLGCAYNHSQIAQFATKGTLKTQLPDIDNEILRKALKLGSQVVVETEKLDDVACRIALDGKQCLQAWLVHFPKNILMRLYLSYPDIVRINAKLNPKRAALVDRFLDEEIVFLQQ